MLLALLGSEPHSQTEQNHLLSPRRGGSEGSWGESRTEAAWGAMGGNLILTEREEQERPPPSPEMRLLNSVTAQRGIFSQ